MKVPPGGGRLGKGAKVRLDPPRLEANTPTETRALAPGEPAGLNDKPQREGVGGLKAPLETWLHPVLLGVPNWT